ncbi:neprilysin 6 [Cochliomyia hominivorax]
MTLCSRFLQIIYVCSLALNWVIASETEQSAEDLQCDTEYWSNIQRQSEQFIDVTEQPCNDFWEYACGNWRPSARLRFAQSTDTLSTIKASNKYLLLQYFDEMESMETVRNAEQNLVKFYKSCLDKTAFKSKSQNELAIRIYTDILKNISSNWPVLQRNYSSLNINQTFNWEQVAAEMRKFGVQTLFSTKIQTNWQNSQQLIFYIMPPTFQYLKVHQSDVTEDPIMEFDYKRSIKLLLIDLGVRVRKANKIAEEIVDFEKSFMSLVHNDPLVVLKEPQTLTSLANEIRDINFLQYFNILLDDFSLPQHYEDLMLIVADHKYLANLVKFLRNANKDTLAKYFLVQFFAHFDFGDLHENYSFIKQKERCLMQLNDFMPSELSRLFLLLRHGQGEEFLQNTEKHLLKMFENLKLQFEKLLNNTLVFERDPATKILSREKLRAMKLMLPSLELTKQEDMKFEMGDNYDINLINLSKLKTARHINKTIPHMVKDVSALKSENRLFLTSLYGDQSYGPLDVNAYYRLKKNVIELPIGILQAPLYDECLKPARNYGGLGYILSHEILHGFDYDGLNYDKYGNVANSWGVKAITKFGVRCNCYLNERYTNAYVKVNENLADSEGLRLALETFLESELDETFDPDDLKVFFLSFAQAWCGNSSKNATSLSRHASHRERVNNVLGNFMEFADVYRCPPGSNMHPEEKCRIW